jgi:hypothetical protein
MSILLLWSSLDWWAVFSEPDLSVVKGVACAQAAARVLSASEQVANLVGVWGVGRARKGLRLGYLFLCQHFG